MSSDQIAYLRDLANSYFSEGNLTAAIATWEQVLAMDPSSLEAKQGITVAQMKMQGVSTDAGSSGPDPDATMMFGDASSGFGGGSPFGVPAPPAGGFDSDRTMVFGGADAPAAPSGGFDAERTMVFGAAAPTPPPVGGFDAERTMVFGGSVPSPAPARPPGNLGHERTMAFNPSLVPPAAPLAPPSGGFDAERTMAFNPSLVPPPPPAAPAAPGAAWLNTAPPAESADATIMSEPSPAGGAFSMPPPSPFLPPPASGAPGGPPGLQDFSLPAPPPSMAPPPAFGGGPSLPPPPSGGGFSFELPPPPSRGGPGLPDLPSVGFGSPPPTFTPAPPPPLAAPPPKKAGAQFGEVDAGEIESLAVPTVGAPAKAKAGDEASQKEREEKLKRDYEQQYGRTPASGPQAPPPRPSTPSRPAVSPKVLGTILAILALVLGGGYFGVKWWIARTTEVFEPPKPPKDPTTGLTKEQAEDLIAQKFGEADKAQRESRLEDAERFINEARDIAFKTGIPVPQRVILKGDEIQRDQQYLEAMQQAIRRFCVEDYPKAHVALLDLERQRPDKLEAGKYIERIFWNLGVEKLQQKEPWEATYYLENLVQRNPADAEARKYLAYAQKFAPSDVLGDDYLDQVDPLATRMAGCR